MKHKNKNLILISILIVVILSVLYSCMFKNTTEGFEWKKKDKPDSAPNNYMCCESPKGIKGVPNNTKFVIKTNNLYKREPNGRLGSKVDDSCAAHGKFIEYQRNKRPGSKPYYKYKSYANPYCILSKASGAFTSDFGGDPSCPADLSKL